MIEVPFYDCIDMTSDHDGWLDIERIYCFDWDSFTREDMEKLRAIFVELPNSERQDVDGCHWWYAERVDIENGYLTAGIEPPGLQVFGTLPESEWSRWDNLFRSRAVGLPVRAGF